MNPATLATTRYTTKAYDPKKKIPAEQFDELVACLRFSPSSVNSQPWHFVVASDAAGKARVAKGAHGASAYNAAKITDASHVVVLCTRTDLDDAHQQMLLDQEQRDGRLKDDAARQQADKTRGGYINLHREVQNDLQSWMEKQTYIALGSLLWSAAAMGIDATPMEGIDFQLLDQELALAERGISSTVVVSLGYRSEQDFNAKLPKSRLEVAQLFDFI